MTKATKEIGTSVISTIGIALGITEERFNALLKIALGAVNYEVKEEATMEEKAAEWNKYLATVTLSLTPHEAVMVGTIIALYLHEGIMDQAGYEDTDEDEEGIEMTAE